MNSAPCSCRWRLFAALCATLFIGMALGAAGLLAAPGVYMALSERLAWRLHWPPATQIALESTLTGLQLRGDKLLAPGATLLFGDSHLHGLPAPVLDGAVNYAIGGEPASRLATRLGRYPSLTSASRVVILSGRNDLSAGSAPQQVETALRAALAAVPSAAATVLVDIPPARESPAAIAVRREISRRSAGLCAALARCHFVALDALADAEGQLRAEYDAGDGIHLNAAGNRLLLAAIFAAPR